MEKIKSTYHKLKARKGQSNHADPLNETSLAKSSLGILYRLPLKVRQLVYENVFCPSYLFTYPAWAGPQGDSGPTLNILRASWAVYREAMPILYRSSTFVFSYKKFFDALEHQHTQSSRFSLKRRTRVEILRSNALEYQYTQSNWRSLKRLTHIEIRLDRRFHDTDTNWEKNRKFFPRFCEWSLGQLAWEGANRRSLMTVTLRIDPAVIANADLIKFLQNWPEEPLTPSLCALVGFRAVILEWHHCCDCTSRQEHPKIPMEPPCKAPRQFQASDNHLLNKLEKALGPAAVEDVNLWKRYFKGSVWAYYNCHHRRWVFDPRAFAESHSMRESDRLPINRQSGANCNHPPDQLH